MPSPDPGENRHHFFPFRHSHSETGKPVQLADTGLDHDAEDKVGNISWVAPPDSVKDEPSTSSKNSPSTVPADEGKFSDNAHKPRGERLLSSIKHGFKEMGHAAKDVGHAFAAQTRSIHDLLSLSKQVSEDLKNTTLYPELQHDAHLRRDNALSPEEAAFLTARKEFIIQQKTLQKFLGLPENEEIHPDDIPIVALGGSGGGYRACL